MSKRPRHGSLTTAKSERSPQSWRITLPTVRRPEAQGVEAMGDPAEICDQLGALHNRFYTPVWDIVLLLLWGGLLAGAYFALRQYVFGDVGLTALLNAGACLVPGCACLYGGACTGTTR